ncbi:TetR/AcrR family transcriptional regulator, partial [Staphylococcus aureus]|nr:TetR/AcrR family transcriptional regulator [Staphylococcus aureus]
LLPLQDTYKEWQHNIENDGLDKVDATIMRLAVDGLWLSEIFGLDNLDESMREKVLDRLTEYTQIDKND